MHTHSGFFLSSWSFYLYEMSIFLFGNTSCLEFYFDIKIATQAFFSAVCMVYLFQSFYFQPVCAFLFKVHLLMQTEIETHT